MTDSVIRAEGLTKSFGSGGKRVQALRELTLEIPRCAIFGLLGHNGAGKSTFFRLCLDLIRADAGALTILGHRPGDPRLFGRVGALIENPRYYPYLTARQTLTMLGRAGGLHETPAAVSYWLGRTRLSDAADRKVRGFSTGMKQRLGVAAAFLSRPELVILDEPTNGLDPSGIQEMRQLLRELTQEHGTTIIVSTHQLDEAQRLCDRIAIIAEGRLVKEGALRQLVGGDSELHITAQPIERVLSQLGARATRSGDRIVVRTRYEDAPALLRELIGAGAEIFEARWQGSDLEQVFLESVKRP
jgi:ABC-2 type transport system ATP-binding protein